MTIWFSRGVPAHLGQSLAGYVAVGPALEDRVDAVGAIAGGEPYSADVFASHPRLRVVSRTGIGVDAIDLVAATEHGVIVTNTPDGPTTSTAEHTIALMLAVTHELAASADRLRRAEGDYISNQRSMELAGRTLGLVGCGRIGRAVRRMAEGIGMTVLVTDPIDPDGVPLDELLATADVVSLHCPATPSTTRLIDDSAFAHMKPGSVLINCARGAVVDTDALVAALESGHLMGAGLDVTDPEPLDPSHPLLHMSNVIVTPHIASSTVAGRERMETMALEQMLMALAGERPTELVNPEVWTEGAS